jgi:hypothetical protein
LLVGTLAACDPPPPPPPTFHVDATDDASDAVPGDGTCATAVGTCTAQAAVEEAGAGGRGVVVLAAGASSPLDVEVTGEVTIVVDTSGDPATFASLTDATVTVAAAGTLVLRSVEVQGAVNVHGTFVAERVALGNPGLVALAVGAQGRAVVVNSHVAPAYAAGRLDVRFSTLAGEAALSLAEGAQVTVGATALIGDVMSCDLYDPGLSVSSLGHNVATDATCGLGGPGDVEDATGDTSPFPDTGSPRIDAIPVGTLGCGSTLVSDVRGFPRPTDGDGDGVAACDIGAWER